MIEIEMISSLGKRSIKADQNFQTLGKQYQFGIASSGKGKV
jgi:hypothetical protein